MEDAELNAKINEWKGRLETVPGLVSKSEESWEEMLQSKRESDEADSVKHYVVLVKKFLALKCLEDDHLTTKSKGAMLRDVQNGNNKALCDYLRLLETSLRKCKGQCSVYSKTSSETNREFNNALETMSTKILDYEEVVTSAIKKNRIKAKLSLTGGVAALAGTLGLIGLTVATGGAAIVVAGAFALGTTAATAIAVGLEALYSSNKEFAEQLAVYEKYQGDQKMVLMCIKYMSMMVLKLVTYMDDLYKSVDTILQEMEEVERILNDKNKTNDEFEFAFTKMMKKIEELREKLQVNKKEIKGLDVTLT